jgi:hypothetical protein
MIIKLTLIGLVLVLIGVIAMSYYVNKEGFDDISNGYLNNLSNDLSSAINTVSSDVSSVVTDNTAANQGINSIPAQTDPVSTIPDTTTNTTVPTRTDIVPQVSISGSGYNAMNLQQQAELLKDIQKVVRNEVLASRSTTPIISGETEQKRTDSTSQGKEYSGSCYKDTEYRCPKNPDGSCPPVPDMTQYIKKDAIPCYGCALDY